MADGNFNISGKGINGEGTFSIANGTSEINLHMVVGEMAQKQEVVIALDKPNPVNSLKTTQSDHTETELAFTKEGSWGLLIIATKLQKLPFRSECICLRAIRH